MGWFYLPGVENLSEEMDIKIGPEVESPVGLWKKQEGSPHWDTSESVQDSSRPLTEHASTQRNDNDKHRETTVVGDLASRAAQTPPLAQGEALIPPLPGLQG